MVKPEFVLGLWYLEEHNGSYPSQVFGTRKITMAAIRCLGKEKICSAIVFLQSVVAYHGVIIG